MNIQTAFHTLDTQIEGIPFQSIEFLCSTEPSTEIISTIEEKLKKAYQEEVMLGHNKLMTPHTGLWYAIVAEYHNSSVMAQLLVDLLTTEGNIDWDLMNEQLLYLVGTLCKTYPESIDLFFDTILKQAKKEKNTTPYTYLFEAVYFSNESHKEKVIEIFKQLEGFNQTIFASMMLETNKDLYLEQAKEIVLPEDQFEDKNSMEFNMNKELIAAIEMAENGELENRCYHTLRGDWKAHYSQLESLFHVQAPSLAEATNADIQRNDPCPCGSGKKFKKCCGALN